MKHYANGFCGLALLAFGGWLVFVSGFSLLTQICLWLGVTMLLSFPCSSPQWQRLLLFARIGLALNVVLYLALVLASSVVLQRSWDDSAAALNLLAWLQWLATPVATAFNRMVLHNDWGIYLYPEYSSLCLTLTALGNIAAHVLLSMLLLGMGGWSLRRWSRSG